jgi:aldehyde dehydrogenase (NAD+)
VWTEDQDRGLALARRVSSGTVSLNSKRILDFGSPFGGLRHSGLGRELGPEGIDAYLESQSIIVSTGLS